jgi:hypothetical protein
MSFPPFRVIRNAGLLLLLVILSFGLGWCVRHLQAYQPPKGLWLFERHIALFVNFVSSHQPELAAKEIADDVPPELRRIGISRIYIEDEILFFLILPWWPDDPYELIGYDLNGDKGYYLIKHIVQQHPATLTHHLCTFDDDPRWIYWRRE